MKTTFFFPNAFKSLKLDSKVELDSVMHLFFFYSMFTYLHLFYLNLSAHTFLHTALLKENRLCNCGQCFVV